jgi:glycosyltransferase involved in cell wall biosynthesis
VEVIHGGIDLSRFHPGPKPDYLRTKWDLPPAAKIVFSPRLMRPLSNIRQIAVAAATVCKKCPDTYFLFAAPGADWDEAYEMEVRTALQKGGVIDHARFLGSIPHDQMADHHRLADVTISIPGTDGTPMTVLESMACGTPVVVGDIPDYDTNYFAPGETVLAVNPDDEAEIADALLRLLQEPEMVEQLTSEARRRVEATGSYESQMSRMEQLYRELL